MAGLIDTHCHLDDDKFAADLPAVVARAQAAGLEALIAIATSAPSSFACLALARTYPSLVYASAGIHPNHITQATPTAWDEVVSLANDPAIVGIGETGLDRHWDDTPFPQQEDYFARHLALSRQSRKPVIIHCREAETDMLRMLGDDFNQHGPIHGVMHSFVGDAAMAKACLEMGLYLSFAGMLTYKSAADLRTVAATLSVERLLVETDSPYLSPVPLRGKRNEPSHVVHTAACLANLLNIPTVLLAERTTMNARRLFSLGFAYSN